uniref:Uncharacterized protein n=1 Tax=Brassica oleracea var. oleracea TaxID=109376 RepID=A0A0D3A7Y1_BRAOL
MNSRNIPRDMFLGIYRGTHSSEYSEGLPRNIPRDSSLGIFRGLSSSEIPDDNSEEHFVGTSEDWTIGKSIGIFRGDFRRTGGPRSFLGIPSEISEEIPRKKEFSRSYFRGLISSLEGLQVLNRK